MDVLGLIDELERQKIEMAAWLAFTQEGPRYSVLLTRRGSDIRSAGSGESFDEALSQALRSLQ